MLLLHKWTPVHIFIITGTFAAHCTPLGRKKIKIKSTTINTTIFCKSGVGRPKKKKKKMALLSSQYEKADKVWTWFLFSLFLFFLCLKTNFLLEKLFSFLWAGSSGGAGRLGNLLLRGQHPLLFHVRLLRDTHTRAPHTHLFSLSQQQASTLSQWQWSFLEETQKQKGKFQEVTI